MQKRNCADCPQTVDGGIDQKRGSWCWSCYWDWELQRSFEERKSYLQGLRDCVERNE